MESINILLKKDELPPPFDFHVPLMELPRIYSTNATNIPSANGYLTANKMLVEAWRTRLGQKEEFRIGIVNLLEEQNHTEESINYFRKAIDIDPDSAIAHGNMGNALYKLGNFNEAEQAYRRSLELKPGIS